jgi:tetratricopeptide (TPR) repeat protein
MLASMTDDRMRQAAQLKAEYKTQEAADLFAAIARDDPGNLRALGEAGTCSLILGQLDKAWDFLTAALNHGGLQDPHISGYQLAASIALNKDTPVNPAPLYLDDLLAAADILTAAGHIQESVTLVAYISEHFAGDPWFEDLTNYYRLITILCKAQLTDIAAPLVQTMRDKAPAAWQTFAAAGALKVAQGDIKAAQQDFNQALTRGGSGNPALLSYISQPVIVATL